MKFQNLTAASVVVGQSGKKSGSDVAPLLKALVTKSQFKANHLLARKMGLAHGDRIQMVIANEGDEQYVILVKDNSDGEDTFSSKLAGAEKENLVPGTQALQFSYSSMYGSVVSYAAEKLNFDATKRNQVNFRIVAELESAQIGLNDPYAEKCFVMEAFEVVDRETEEEEA